MKRLVWRRCQSEDNRDNVEADGEISDWRVMSDEINDFLGLIFLTTNIACFELHHRIIMIALYLKNTTASLI